MANVAEIEQFDEGIYQLETTDQVIGGANGTSNYQAKGLANRTKYLNAKKADKVLSPTNGNFAALDSNGNLTDSGHKHSDYDAAGAAASVNNSLGDLIDSLGDVVTHDANEFDAAGAASAAQSAAISAAASDATSKANTAESNAKSYADSKFVDRGDPASDDFTSFTINDAAYHELNLSSIVTSDNVTFVLINYYFVHNGTTATLNLRKKGNTNEISAIKQSTNNFPYIAGQALVPISADKKIEYKISVASGTLSTSVLSVVGWY